MYERLSKFIYHTIYPQPSFTNINSLPSSLSPSFAAGCCVAYAILFMISVENPPQGWCLAATVHWLFPSSEFPLMVVPAKWSHEEESRGNEGIGRKGGWGLKCCWGLRWGRTLAKWEKQLNEGMEKRMEALERWCSCQRCPRAKTHSPFSGTAERWQQ